MLALILFSALMPLICGIMRFVIKSDNALYKKLGAVVPPAFSLIASLLLVILHINGESELFSITDDIRFILRVDTLSCFFAVLFSFAFLLTSVFAKGYFEKDDSKQRFDGFYLITLGALMLLAFSGNLLTMYICFEAVTLSSMPMVLHDKTRESVDAAIKYLLYSIGGAFLGFIGVVYFSANMSTDTFALGGCLKEGVASSEAFTVILLITLIGFGAKCGMFPLHNWLPTAHPVAPAPASALLSGIITKSGIIAIIRIVYYYVGTEAIRGTYAHTVWLILILTTILLGSFMAAVQKNFKRRLAYSTVSQVSYVLLGIALLNEEALSGAMLQIASHAIIKIGLFLSAGAIIHLSNKHNVDELDGIGKKMPITLWCYTVLSLGLVGVPPTVGFVAKWYIAAGALKSSLGAFAIIAPVALIISAILTAYYLLSCTVKAFFPNEKTTCERIKEPLSMTAPLIILSFLTVALGLFASPVLSLVGLL